MPRLKKVFYSVITGNITMLFPSPLLCDPNNLSTIKMSHAFMKKFIRLCIFYKFAIYFCQIIVDQIGGKVK